MSKRRPQVRVRCVLQLHKLRRGERTRNRKLRADCKAKRLAVAMTAGFRRATSRFLFVDSAKGVRAQIDGRGRSPDISKGLLNCFGIVIKACNFLYSNIGRTCAESTRLRTLRKLGSEWRTRLVSPYPARKRAVESNGAGALNS